MRLLALLSLAAACNGDAPVCREASRPRPAAIAAPVVAPVAVAPPSPSPAIAATDEPTVPLSHIVYPIPDFTPSTKRLTVNTWLGDALDYIARGGGDIGGVVMASRAVVADPGDARARFVEACALAQAGQHAHAPPIVQLLRDARGCSDCNDLLVLVQRGTCGFDEPTRALAAGAKPSALRLAAERVMAAINSGDAESIGADLDGDVVMATACSVCDEDVVTKQRFDAVGFRTFVRGAEKRIEDGPVIYHAPAMLFCDGRCCGGPTGMLSHTSEFITEVCFRDGKLASIDVISGG